MAPKSLKVVVVGDSGVGKTELMHRMTHGSFNGSLGSTVMSCYSTLPRRTMQGRQVGLWDTAGSERMSQFLPNYLRGSDLCLLCFRMGDEASIAWLDRILNKNAVDIDFPQCVVVATQCDRWEPGGERLGVVRSQDHVDGIKAQTPSVARQRLGLSQPVYVTSSLDGTGVADLVEHIYAFLEENAKSRSTSDLPPLTEDDTNFRSSAVNSLRHRLRSVSCGPCSIQ